MVKKSIKKSLIKRNILQYLEIKGISKYAFYNLTGIARGTLDNESGLTKDGIAKFIAHYNDVNIEWLITGIGDMLSDQKVSIVNEPNIDYEKHCPHCMDKDKMIEILSDNVSLYKFKVKMLTDTINSMKNNGGTENISKTA